MATNWGTKLSASYPMAMGLFGSIVGGSIGAMLGGPVGAVLGAMIGGSAGRSNFNMDDSWPGYDQVRPGREPYGQPRPQELQMIFAIALTSLAAKVAKADGVVSQSEVKAFDSFLKDQMQMSVEDRRIAADVFNEAKQSSASTRDFTKQIKQLLAGQPERLNDIVSILCGIAMADGHFHDAEKQVIGQIARELGLSDAQFKSCMGTYQQSDPYQVLGVPATATDAEVRAAHRKLVKDYHPDVLRSKGLADDFQEFAKQKMAAVNEAWNLVKTQRNL